MAESTAATGDRLPADSPVSEIPGDEERGPEKGIALCLSGGGYRAMLFHVGVLWRLREAGCLRKLKRISSVSGGSITAGVLGMNWMQFVAGGETLDAFNALIVLPIREQARRTVDEGAIIRGILLPGSISDKVEAAYDKHLFRRKTLQDLPDDAAGPRFVFNATNVQTGALWRFSKPYMGDWRVGRILHPDVPLAKAVAASSAFPPVLSPLILDVEPGRFDRETAGELFGTPFNDEIVLSDGGVYDNLGLETAYKRYTGLLVSDAGKRMDFEGSPKDDWARHSIRVLDVIDNQVRSLRKRLLIEAFKRGDRSGAYWSIGSRFADYEVADPLGIGGAATAALAVVATRLKRMEEPLQERLINWGYAICDAALRKHCAEWLSREHGVEVRMPEQLPYPEAGLD